MNIYKKKKVDNNLKNFYLKREKNNSIVFRDYVLYLTSFEYELITKNVEVWTGSNIELIEIISEMIYSNNVDSVSEYVKTIKMMAKFL